MQRVLDGNGLGEASEAAGVMVTRHHHAHAAPDVRASSDPSDSAVKRLGAAAQGLVALVELASLRGHRLIRRAPEHRVSGVADQLPEPGEELPRVVADRGAGAGRQHQRGDGDPDRRADRRLLDPGQQQRNGELPQQPVEQASIVVIQKIISP